jgi:hypothetical protein
MAEKGKRRRRQFTPEFKRDAVELVRATGRPIAYIAAVQAWAQPAPAPTASRALGSRGHTGAHLGHIWGMDGGA